MMRIFIYIGILLGLSAHAYEVDNFTDRETLKKDALPVLDAKINKILSRAVYDTQKEVGNQCSVARLRQEILRWMRPDPTGILETWLVTTDEIERTHVGISESIYKDVSFTDAPLLLIAGIGRTILLNGLITGTDKIGHFFFQGLDYYDLVQSGKPLEKVLVEDHQEDGKWGLETSGVKSYADMAANYQGYLFWSQLTQGKNPYIKCDEKKGWVNNRTFTWAGYVNPAWDEALNCSEMRPIMQVKVERYIKSRGWSCPLQADACLRVTQQDHAEFFTSPKCKTIQEPSGERSLASSHAKN